jgi:hypothetical protein
MDRPIPMAAFVAKHLPSLVEHCLSSAPATATEPNDSLRGWFSHLFAELVWALEEDNPDHFSVSAGFASGAAAHRIRCNARGKSLVDIVAETGLVCDATCKLAADESYAFSARDVRILNMFVDGVIAQGVEDAASRERQTGAQSPCGGGMVGIELANAAAVMSASLDALRSGRVGIHSKTFELLELAVKRVEDLSRSLIADSVGHA